MDIAPLPVRGLLSLIWSFSDQSFLPGPPWSCSRSSLFPSALVLPFLTYPPKSSSPQDPRLTYFSWHTHPDLPLLPRWGHPAAYLHFLLCLDSCYFHHVVLPKSIHLSRLSSCVSAPRNLPWILLCPHCHLTRGLLCARHLSMWHSLPWRCHHCHCRRENLSSVMEALAQAAYIISKGAKLQVMASVSLM